ncbi:MAG: hypothetical protein K2I67_02455 [Malacoplasma sp.]|nr:hypothetical protein [Malacoplasma sp.]
MKIDKLSYREFSDSNESSEWGNKIYKQWAENYKSTSEKVKSVDAPPCCEIPFESYCGNNYLSTNSNLRDSNVNETNEEHYVLFREICSAPVIPENIVVYRLVCDEVIERLTTIRDDKPYIYEEKGFMSTSLLKSIVKSDEQYTEHKNMLKIYVSKNTIGVYVNVITKRSEEEILFVSGMRLGLINKPYNDKAIGKTIYECVMLNGKYNKP